MTIQKIKSGRVTSLVADDFVGEIGQIFYNEELGDLRLSDGVTPGGQLLAVGGSGGGTPLQPATTTRLGGIKVGYGLSITTGGILSINLPLAAPDVVGGIKIGAGLLIDSTGVVSLDPDSIPSPSSTSLIVKKSGVVLTSHASSINFTGSGVMATVSGNDVTLQIEGGGGTGGLYGVNLDGGQPDSIYGGVNPIDGGYI
jgi:hypothetical protein